MKASFRKIILFNILIINAGLVNHMFSQIDSVRTNYSLENADSSDYNYHRKYQYLDINLKNETNILKLALPAFGNSQGFYPASFNSFYLIFEKKINTSISLMLENSNIFTQEHKYPNPYANYSSYLNYGIRKYLFMEKRIKEGTSGNNFNGEYIDFFIMGLNEYGYHNKTAGNFDLSFSDFSHIINKSPTFEIGLGLQKRLNNYCFLDTKIFISYGLEKTYNYKTLTDTPDPSVTTSQIKIPSAIHFGIDFKIGFGKGWK